MEANQIVVNNKAYNIDKIYYRTKGSCNQILTEDTNNSMIEPYVRFLLTNNMNNNYWIKEVSFPSICYENYPVRTNCTNEVRKEFENIKQSDFIINIDGNTISAVKAIDYEENRLVLEYCNGYEKYNTSLNINKNVMKRLLFAWSKKLTLNNYDMNINNTLVKKKDGVIKIKMVDFADSHIRPVEQCESLIRDMVQ